MGLAGYAAFKRQNPEEALLDAKAEAVFEWLLQFRWDEGATSETGTGAPNINVVDTANSDDLSIWAGVWSAIMRSAGGRTSSPEAGGAGRILPDGRRTGDLPGLLVARRWARGSSDRRW